MLLHQLGEDIIFLGQFLLQLGDLVFQESGMGILFVPEGPLAVFKKLLLPAVEHIRVDAVFLANIGNITAFH